VKRPAPKKVRRQIFVLTPEEKRTICFVLIAFILGLGTKHYRAAQPLPSVKTAVKETAASSSRSESK
jgi:hypothetical protein